MNSNNIFQLFWYIPKEIQKFVGNKNIATTIYLCYLQAYVLIIYVQLCIEFTDLFNNKILIDCINLFSVSGFKKNMN